MNIDLIAAVAAIAAILAGIFGYGRSQRKKGREDIIREGKDDADKRIEKGERRVSDGRDLDPDERVRRNDSRW